MDRQALLRLRRIPRDGPLPLSFAQERLWFLDRLEPGRATYNLPALFLRLRGTLDHGTLQRVLDELARRHESLRTTFTEVDGRPVQVIAPAGPFLLPIVDLRDVAAGVREGEARALAAREAARPFDLVRGPVSRALLARLADQEHLFLFVQHHIVSDGWSVDVLRRELAALYAAFVEGRPSPLPELPVQPADFAQWQRDHFQGKALAPLLGWWKERLGGSLPLLELPADHARPAVRSLRGGRVTFTLGPEVAAGLRQAARRQGSTAFMFLFAAFQALLHRVTGQTDLLVGFPVAGRGTAEIEGLVGFFVNTLVLRTDVADDPAWTDLLQRVRNAILDALDQQDLPFERLVEELQPERALSHTPLVQVLFTLRTEPGEMCLPGLSLSHEKIATGTAKLDLVLGIADGPEGLSGRFEYSLDLFEPATVERLGGQFRRLLQSALARPRERLSELPLLSEAESHQLLAEWNDTRRRDPGALVHELFAERAREAPDAPALLFGREVVTYGELAERAERLARHLRTSGVGPESRVGVEMERSPELIVALLGVLQAGGAYVPVDPAQPLPRRLAILRESGARLLLTQDGSLTPVPSPASSPASGRPIPGAGRPLPDNLAYVMSTSGSTGRPKGVAVPHRAVVRLVRDAGYAELGPEQVFLQLSPVSFDASTFEIWGCLLNGGRLVIFPPHLPSLAELGGVIREAGVTTLWLTAGLFHSMVEERVEDLAGVAQLLAGGDVLSPVHVRRALAALPGTRVIDGYGPTESTTFACCHAMTALDAPAGAVPIGRPIGNTRAYVVDRHLRPVPIGVQGDLLLGGDGLARGYEGAPELTAERFVPDPFARGGRLYRTGDRARLLPDGRLEYLGRSDAQVKIRGFRVEPGEIESALCDHPEVAEAAVVVEGREAHARRLVGFVVPRAGARPAPRSVREWLKERLPLYMVPAAVAVLDELPLTAHGKVDRKTLAARAGEAARSAPRELAPPRTDLERRLADLWAEILGVGRVGIHDSFFDLGGDSLLAIQMVSRAGRAGVLLSLRQLFRHQTVAELAASVETSEAVRGEQGWVTGPVPMTPGQVWFFDRVAEHLGAPHQFSTRQLLEIREPVTSAQVARAAAWMLFQHDALRLRVTRRDDRGDDRGGAWEQHNAGPEALADSWSEIDLGAVPEAAQDGAVAAAVRQLHGRGELEGPLARFVLFGQGPARRARLLIVLHHLVSDAASWRILREDLETALRQLHRGEEVRLPSKTTSFRAWALRQQELARSHELRRQVDFWLRLVRVGGQRLPADFPAGEAGTGESDSVSVELGVEETRELLQALPAARRARFTDAVLVAVARAFLRWTRSGTLLIRQSLHGRDPVFEDVDLSRTVGWIATTAPVLLELDGAESPAEALAAVTEQIERVPLRGLGYGVLRYMSGDPEIEERMATVVAGPAATFNFIGRFDGDAAAGLLTEVPVRVEAERAIPRRDPQLRIGGAVAGSPARLVLTWRYGRDFYRRETIARLAESCLEELRGLIGRE